jgi:hypothetical protein
MDQGWQVTGYQAPTPCASPSSTPPPTTGPTEQAPTTNAGIPTGGFSGIPVS